MKHVKTVILSLPIIMSVYTMCRTATNKPKPAKGQVVLTPWVIEKFCLGVERMKTIYKKNPNDPLCKTLDEKTLNTNVDVESIIKIGHKLEKNKEVGPRAKKIARKLDKKTEFLKRCFVDGDKESCKKFGRMLRNSALKCGGLSCLWNRATWELAAFTAAAQCIEQCEK